MPDFSIPGEEDAKNAVLASLGEPLLKAKRFATGNHHYVYDVTTASGRHCVARLTLPAELQHFEGALYWSRQLRPLGVPLPDIIASDFTCGTVPFPYLIMERLNGSDLGEVYSGLSRSDMLALASEMALMHGKLHAMPQGNGFGYAFNYSDPFPFTSWREVVLASLDRSRARIIEAGVFDANTVAQVESKMGALEHYFASIPSKPFLHDTSTKNVIIEDGKISGIVDVDSLCFGDALLTPALTHMALLAHGHDGAYVKYWLERLGLSDMQYRAFLFYTAQCCVDFMGEIGQPFNGNFRKDDKAYCQHLSSLLESLLSKL